MYGMVMGCARVAFTSHIALQPCNMLPYCAKVPSPLALAEPLPQRPAQLPQSCPAIIARVQPVSEQYSRCCGRETLLCEQSATGLLVVGEVVWTDNSSLLKQLQRL